MRARQGKSAAKPDRLAFAAGRTIDRNSPMPYHHQLHEILRDAIDRNVWQAGEMIPSEAELAANYGISRTVIRKALDRLVAAGRVQRLKGKGTVIQPVRFRHELNLAAVEWAGLMASVTVGRILDSRIVLAGPVGAPLGLDADRAVFQITCLQTQEAKPVALTHLFLRTDVSSATEQAAQAGDALDLEEHGSTLELQLATRFDVQVIRSEASIEPTLCGEFEARELGIDGHQPVFCLTTLSYDRNGSPIAYGQTIFTPERSRIGFVTKKGQPLPGSV
jgi:DNA-binding GntR family transcriptional regulator